MGLCQPMANARLEDLNKNSVSEACTFSTHKEFSGPCFGRFAFTAPGTEGKLI
jgi:hypothetical protein